MDRNVLLSSSSVANLLNVRSKVWQLQIKLYPLCRTPHLLNWVRFYILPTLKNVIRFSSLSMLHILNLIISDMFMSAKSR